jgi:NTE family protein
MSIAFVLSGGASLGAVQVGMLQALDRHGIRPELIVGTSVGALNGAFIAGHPGREALSELASIWGTVRRQDVFPIGPLRGALGYYGFRNSLVRPEPLRRLAARYVGFSRLEDSVVPLHVVATDATSGLDVLLSSGDAVQAVLASAAIPAVFPPVRIDDRDLVDGGIANNTPISHAVRLGATKLYVLPTGFACALPRPPETALGMALHALTLLFGQRLSFDVERYEPRCELHVVPPPCPLEVSPADFTRSAEMIAAAYESTSRWLETGEPRPPGGQAELTRPHAHGGAAVA